MKLKDLLFPGTGRHNPIPICLLEISVITPACALTDIDHDTHDQPSQFPDARMKSYNRKSFCIEKHNKNYVMADSSNSLPISGRMQGASGQEGILYHKNNHYIYNLLCILKIETILFQSYTDCALRVLAHLHAISAPCPVPIHVAERLRSPHWPAHRCPNLHRAVATMLSDYYGWQSPCNIVTTGHVQGRWQRRCRSLASQSPAHRFSWCRPGYDCRPGRPAGATILSSTSAKLCRKCLRSRRAARFQTMIWSSAAQKAFMSSAEPTVTRDMVGQMGQLRPISTLRLAKASRMVWAGCFQSTMNMLALLGR